MLETLFRITLLISISLIAACASSPGNQGGNSSSQPKGAQIIGNIPSGSPFSKIKIGMSQKQVHDLIGQPTDIGNHMTGKMFIPFYFGNDVMRAQDLYKGQGRITYTGAGIGGVNFHVYTIEYDTSEDGYN